MRIELPSPSLVLLMGVTGSGKSTFAARHFLSTEVISSDVCRGLVADDPNDQGASEDAFAVLQEIASRRLARGRLTVIDATNVQRSSRAPLVALARRHDLFPVAIVLDVRGEVCAERNAARPDRDFGSHVIRRQQSALRGSLKGLQREGFRRWWVLRGDEEAEIVRRPLWSDRRAELGPFDVIGDIHGCADELRRAAGRARLRRRRAPGGAAAGVRGRLRGPRAATRRRCCGSSCASRPRGRRSACPATTTPSSCGRWTGPRRRSRTGSPSRWRSSRPIPSRAPATSWRSWSRTWCSTRGGSWSRTPGCRSATRAARPSACASSPCMARRRGRPTSSGCRCAARGRTTTAAPRRSSTGTRRWPTPSGSTTRSTSIPAACSAGG